MKGVRAKREGRAGNRGNAMPRAERLAVLSAMMAVEVGEPV